MATAIHNITYGKLEPADFAQAHALWNAGAQNEYPHRKLSPAQFSELFLTSTDHIAKVNVAAKDGDILVGFANGCVVPGKGIGYITFVLVDPAYRREGIGSGLLWRLEEVLGTIEPLESYQISFFNPINLTWMIPGSKEHDHPNAPGIEVTSGAYIFFKNRGYIDTAYQNSFYLPLADFQIASKIQERIDTLPEKGLSICLYDREKHFGLDELFTDLGNELWREEIMGNVNRPDGGEPVLIAEHKGQAVGFTGPLHVQESGRGYFAGIGVHSEFRKFGLGKALFSMLCKTLKDMGAGYMTLFTGETNPARNIYQSAGFKIVKSWTDMEKKVQK